MLQRLWQIFVAFVCASMVSLASADAVPGASADKFVFHITDSGNARGLFNNARNLAQSYDGKVKIVVVANGGGVDFLLQEATDKNGNPYVVDIENLQGMGVEFRVCLNTLRSRKIDPKSVVDGVQLVPAGIVEVARLQAREGYHYIKP